MLGRVLDRFEAAVVDRGLEFRLVAADTFAANGERGDRMLKRRDQAAFDPVVGTGQLARERELDPYRDQALLDPVVEIALELSALIVACPHHTRVVRRGGVRSVELEKVVADLRDGEQQCAGRERDDDRAPTARISESQRR
jgi:hypothetical protein